MRCFDISGANLAGAVLERAVLWPRSGERAKRMGEGRGGSVRLSVQLPRKDFP